MNTFKIDLGLRDSKGVDLKLSLSIRSLTEGQVELVLVSDSAKGKGGKSEQALGIVETPILARTIDKLRHSALAENSDNTKNI